MNAARIRETIAKTEVRTNRHPRTATRAWFQYAIAGLLALVCTAASTSRAEAVCSVVLEATTDVTLGALQVEIDYGSADGDFSGIGTAVDCTDLSGGDAISANDDDAGAILRIGWIALNGIDAPTQLVRCSFTAFSEPSLSDFQVEIVDASDTGFAPIGVNVRLSLDDCGISSARCGDVNSDGAITSNDALLVLKAAVGLPAPLNCSGVPSQTTTTTTTTTTMGVVQRTLQVDKTGAGSGLVVSDPGAISCGSGCFAEYLDGTIVTLTAMPNNSSTFLGWDGNVPAKCKDPASLGCTFTMNRNRIVTASFGQEATGCPQGAPIRDLRVDCSSTVYAYANSVEVAGLVTDGIDVPVVVLPVGGGDGVGLLGEVTGARGFAWTIACLLDQFGNVDECGSVPGNGTISSSGQTLTLFLGSDSYVYSFVDTSVLLSAPGLSGSSPIARAERTAVTLDLSKEWLSRNSEQMNRAGRTDMQLVNEIKDRL